MEINRHKWMLRSGMRLAFIVWLLSAFKVSLYSVDRELSLTQLGKKSSRRDLKQFVDYLNNHESDRLRHRQVLSIRSDDQFQDAIDRYGEITASDDKGDADCSIIDRYCETLGISQDVASLIATFIRGRWVIQNKTFDFHSYKSRHEDPLNYVCSHIDFVDCVFRGFCHFPYFFGSFVSFHSCFFSLKMGPLIFGSYKHKDLFYHSIDFVKCIFDCKIYLCLKESGTQEDRIVFDQMSWDHCVFNCLVSSTNTLCPSISLRNSRFSNCYFKKALEFGYYRGDSKDRVTDLTGTTIENCYFLEGIKLASKNKVCDLTNFTLKQSVLSGSLDLCPSEFLFRQIGKYIVVDLKNLIIENCRLIQPMIFATQYAVSILQSVSIRNTCFREDVYFMSEYPNQSVFSFIDSSRDRGFFNCVNCDFEGKVRFSVSRRGCNLRGAKFNNCTFVDPIFFSQLFIPSLFGTPACTRYFPAELKEASFKNCKFEELVLAVAHKKRVQKVQVKSSLSALLPDLPADLHTEEKEKVTFFPLSAVDFTNSDRLILLPGVDEVEIVYFDVGWTEFENCVVVKSFILPVTNWFINNLDNALNDFLPISLGEDSYARSVEKEEMVRLFQNYQDADEMGNRLIDCIQELGLVGPMDPGGRLVPPLQDEGFGAPFVEENGYVVYYIVLIALACGVVGLLLKHGVRRRNPYVQDLYETEEEEALVKL